MYHGSRGVHACTNLQLISVLRSLYRYEASIRIRVGALNILKLIIHPSPHDSQAHWISPGAIIAL